MNRSSSSSSPCVTLLWTALPWTAVAALGCGRNVSVESYKTAGVGLRPDEIGPEPTPYGGLIEYHHIEFAGAALPLGLTGLVSFDEVGPGTVGMKPPYALVTGTAFVLDSDLPQMDVLFGTFGAPHAAVGSCYTSFEPRAYLNTTADVGTAISFTGTSADFSFSLDRRPGMYPENNVKNLFPYYTSLSTWRPTPQLRRADPGDRPVGEADHVVLRPANYLHGQDVVIRFPGGIPPEDASVSSIPVPLATGAGDVKLRLPRRPDGVMLSWQGNRYDRAGNVVSDGEVRSCFEFALRDAEPSSPEDCLAPQEFAEDPDAIVPQMYTGPWDTTSGVTFRWLPQPEDAQGDADLYDKVVIGVRLLGPVDTDSEYKRVSRIATPASDAVKDRWAELQADPYCYIPPDAEVPATGYREALPCEREGQDFEWVVDPALLKDPADPSSFVDSLQGEPSYTVAELVCNVDGQSGEFTVTPEMMAFALEYGSLHGASGAVFYFGRTSSINVNTPPVRDRYGQRRDIAPVRVQSTSAKLGRFWWAR